MNIKFGAIFAVFLMMLAVLSGCAINPMSVIKGNPEIKQFLADHPNADISVIRITGDAINNTIASTREICGPEMAAKAYYKVKIVDASENLTIYAFIDEKDQALDCFKKIGGKAEPVKTEDKSVPEEKKTEEIKEKPKPVENKPVVTTDVKTDTVVVGQKEIKLESYSESPEKIKLKWEKYVGSDFQGYKVVSSQKVENPKYPENGYVTFITEQDKTEFVLETKEGYNFYAITVLTKDGKVYSNPVKFYREKTEDNETEDDESVPTQSISLKYVKGDNSEIKLYWTKYEGDDLQYYKVVWSQKNKDLMYPEDGYIKYFTNPAETSMLLDASQIGNGTNFYRVSAILNGFYESSDKNLKRINSNVIEFNK